MKIESHWYSLQPLTKLNSQVGSAPRFGSLLRVTFSEDEVGYTDLHPWTEWGDQPLHEQIRLLKSGMPTQLAQKALEYAKIDAEARAQGRSVFTQLPEIQNHILVTDPRMVLPESCSGQVVKLKVGRDLKFERDWIEAFCKGPGLLRIDFNSSVKGGEFLKWIAGFSVDELKKIDYVEDPCPFDAEVWSQAMRFVQLAVDRETVPSEWRSKFVLVSKPTAVDGDIDPLEFKRVVFTHKMDHPFGARIAQFVASTFYHLHPGKKEICGLDLRGTYRKTGFESFERGTGFGYNAVLRELKWTAV